MKGLYFIKEELEECSGVSKKVNSQIKALEKLGIKMELSYSIKKKKHIFRKVNDLIIDEFPHSIFGRLKKKIFYYKKIQEYILDQKIKFIYIRYSHFADKYFIKFLKRLRKEKIKIFLEIPTYPYDEEIKGMKLKNILKEKKYRIRMKEYVDKIITFSQDNEIFGIKTIKISNGVDLNTTKLINKNKENNSIDFIEVAMISFWHGFDRFILSMAEYYKTNPKQIIKFHIVGSGDNNSVEELKKLVRDNQLEKYVIFYGFKTGEELDEIYNKTDIAVGSLGFSRSGDTVGSTLKVREYCAKGIPFIIGYKDLSLTEDLEFYYEVSNDESLLDINKILEWYKNLNISPDEIRKFAEENLSWDKQMKIVLENI